MSQAWLRFTAQDIATELDQARDEGRDLPDDLRAEAERLLASELSATQAQEAIGGLLDRIVARPIRRDFPYDEPSDLDGIRAQRPTAPAVPAVDRKALADRLQGAWLGRACGCLLGKPVEGWRRERLHAYLRETGQWPLRAYIRGDAPAEVRARYQVGENAAFIERVHGMPEDDDVNYTVAALGILRERGYGFTPEDVARFWLARIPISRTFTAERVAYRNLVDSIPPPDSAAHRNPYREWIGAQIRADLWGYACPGDPARAAELAWRDACVSHVKNGIYGAMWSAAMNAAAFAQDDPQAVVEAGLAQIPARCRLAEWLRKVLDWHESGVSHDEADARVHAAWDEAVPHHLLHTISNAAIVAAALLWGECDYGKSICLAVQVGFDTDCNGATVGSVAGAMLGASGIPAEWPAPINDTLETGVVGYSRAQISELARQTLELVRSQQA
jgi:ADP-ribosylglycohydrolase